MAACRLMKNKTIWLEQYAGEIGDRPMEISAGAVERLLALKSKFHGKIGSIAHVEWLRLVDDATNGGALLVAFECARTSGAGSSSWLFFPIR